MGLLIDVTGICNKCKKWTVFDGPYSACGCYAPPVEEVKPHEELSAKEISEIRRLLSAIKKELSNETN